LRLSETYYSDKPVNVGPVVCWRHLDSPLGPSTTVELVEGGDTVGRMWVQVHEWQVGACKLQAANPCDFLIREDHRRLPAFMSLFKATMNESQRLTDFVYHTSNPLTDDLYRKLFKLNPVAELDVALLPIRPLAAAQATNVVKTGILGRIVDHIFCEVVQFIGRLARMTKVQLSDAPSISAQEAVLSEFLSQETVCAIRNASYRNWRFRGAGPIAYKEHWVTKSGKTIGYVVTSDRDLNGIKACFVIDVVLPGAPSRLTLCLMWLQIMALAAKRGREAIFLFYNRSNLRLARIASLPMLNVPRRFLPQQVPVFVRPSNNVDSAIFNGVNWSSGYFVMSDFDMF